MILPLERRELPGEDTQWVDSEVVTRPNEGLDVVHDMTQSVLVTVVITHPEWIVVHQDLSACLLGQPVELTWFANSHIAFQSLAD